MSELSAILSKYIFREMNSKCSDTKVTFSDCVVIILKQFQTVLTCEQLQFVISEKPSNLNFAKMTVITSCFSLK